MSSFYTLIKEVPTRILDPISAQVIDSTINKLGLSKYLSSDAPNVVITTDRENMSVFNHDDGANNWDTDYRLDVNVETNINPAVDQFLAQLSPNSMPSYGMSNTWKNSYRQVFLDKEIGFSAQEVTVPCTMTFTFRFTTPTYESAFHLMGWIFNRTSEGSINEVHDLVYSYPLDGEILGAIYSVFKYRNAWKQANPDANHLYDYVNYIAQSQWGIDTRNPNLRYDTDNIQFSQENQPSLKRVQLNCPAQLTCDQKAPDGVSQGESNTAYTVEFTYTIVFGRPHMLEFTVPPVVEQQSLDPTLFKDEEKSTNLNLAGSYSNLAFSKPKLWMDGELYSKQLLVRYPKYDKWYIPHDSNLHRYNFMPLVIGICTIPVMGSPVSISLKDFTDIEISPFVYDILQMHNTDDLFGYNGLFNVTVFSNGFPLDHKFLTWDPKTWTITFTGDRLCNTYRIVFSEANTFTRMDKKWAQVIADNRWYFPMSIITNLDYLIKTGVMKIGSGNRLTALISGLRNNNQLPNVLSTMIAAGVSEHIWAFTQTDGQLAAYLCSTPFVPPIGNLREAENPMSILDVRIRSMFDLFIQTCLSLGLCTQSMVPQLQVLAQATEPYQVTNGGLINGFNVPLRVFYSTITAERRDSDCGFDGGTGY